jgi:uncharacterized repeat protein (TIGR01451 family)
MPIMRSEPHSLASWRWMAFLLTTLTLTLVLTQAPAASAIGCTPISDFPAPPPNAPLPGSCFEGYDGNQVDPDAATPDAPAPANRLDWGSTEVLADAQRALDYTQAGGADSQFTQGMEEDPDTWKWGVGSLGSDKYNMISGYSYSEANTQDLMLALAFVRESNNGTSWLAFELNQKLPGYRTEPLVGAVPAQTLDVPTRSAGDLLITYSVSNNNSPKPVIGLCKWLGNENGGVWTNMSGVPVASNCPPLSASVAQADLNGADIPANQNYLGSPAGLLQAGTFGEASINLTEAFKAAGGNPNTDDDCLSFGYMWAHSRSSEPITSAQQDFILPSDAISAANCAVEGTKWHDKNGNGLIDGTDEGLGGWTIFADYDNDGVLDPGEPSDVTSDGTDGRDPGAYSLVKLADGTYPIREVAQAGWQCTSPDPIDTDPTAADPTSPALCATEVDMTGAVIDGVDFLNFDAQPSISLDKTAVLVAAGADPVAGDKITYSFEITNTGNVALDGVDLDDALVGKDNATCEKTALAVGEKANCTADYTLTQADVDAGKVDNLADACGDSPQNVEVCDPDDTSTPLPAAPSISLDKTGVLVAAGANPVAGDKITYSFEITNTGNVTLDGVDLDDALVGKDNATCEKTVLAPGEKADCTADYTLTQADVDAGKVDNLADACGDSPANVEVCDPDDTSTPLPADPKIDLEKTGVLVAAGAAPVAGDKITYTFEITNTGNVTLSGVDLDDALVGKANAACDKTTLAPGDKTSCTADYTLTQADVDAGKVDNAADACGDSPKGVEVCDDDSTSTPLPAAPKIDLEKFATLNLGGDGLQAGDTITYEFVITNTGNVTLDGVDLDDSLLGLTNVVCNAVTVLAPGAKTTCTQDYTLTQADVDAGKVDNLADACGDSPKDVEVCDDDSTSTPLDPDAGIQLEKTAVLSAPVAPKPGDKITYTFEIENVGNVTLDGTDLDDALVGKDNAVCGTATLAPGAKTSCTADYTLTQADIDSGAVTNIADACGDTPADVEVCDDDTTTTPLPAAPSIDLKKTGVLNAPAAPKAGDTITYTFVITNTGNVTLSGADLDDALVGFSDATCGATSLASGAATNCTANYTLTQDDIDAGSVTNVADVCADPPVGGEVCDDDTTTTPLNPTRGILVEKDGPATAYHGDKVTYTFLVSNAGNVTLTSVKATDDKCAPVEGPVAFVKGDDDNRLEVGEQWRYTCTTTIGAHAGGEANPVVNTVTASGVDPQGTTLTDTDTHSLLILHPAVQIEKTGPATANAGDRVAFTLVVTNPGDVPLTGQTLSVVDSKCDAPPQLVAKKRGAADDATPDTLDPGDSWAYTCSVPTAIGEASITNVASVTGEDPNKIKVSDDDDATVTLQQPKIAVLPAVVDPGAARVSGPSKCVSKAFTSRVTGKRIKKVVWTIDGKKVKTFTSKTGEARQTSLKVNPNKYGKGVHRLQARITFASNSGTAARTLRLTFQQCAKQIIAPKFTG